MIRLMSRTRLLAVAAVAASLSLLAVAPSVGSVGSVGAAAPPTLPPGYVTLVDDTGRISVSVPPTWTDIDTAPAADAAGVPLPYIAAAPSLDSFANTFDTPGVRYVAFPYAPDPQVLVDSYGLPGGCANLAVEPYDDSVFAGLAQVGAGCGPGQASWIMVVASPADQSFTALVQVQAGTPPDQQSVDVVLLSFNVASGSPTAPTAPLPTVAAVPTVVPVPTVGAVPTLPALPTAPVATAAPLPTVGALPTLAPLPTAGPQATVAPLPTMAPGATVPPLPTAPGATAGTAVTVTDDTGRLSVQVPASWSQAETAPAENGNPFLMVSPDLATYNNTDPAISLTTQGLIMMAGSYMADTASALSFVAGGLGAGCTPTEVQPFDDGVYVGSMQLFGGCGGTETFKTIIVANPPSQAATVTLIIQLQSIDDPALALILGSFDVTG